MTYPNGGSTAPRTDGQPGASGAARRRREDGTCWTCARSRCLGWLSHEIGRVRNTIQSREIYASRRAWLRASIDRHMCRYNLEHCHRCGRRVAVSFWATTGWTNVVRDGGCLRCIRCFDREAWLVGEPVCWLAVTFEEFDQRVARYFADYDAGRVR